MNKSGIISVGLLVVILIGSVKYYESAFKELEAEKKLAEREVEYWVDKNGKSRARIESLETEIEVVKSVKNQEIVRLEEEIDGLKARNIQSFTQINTITKDSIITQLVYDTLEIKEYQLPPVLNWTYRDKWSNMVGKINLDQMTTQVNYTIIDSLTTVDFYKKMGFLKPKKRYYEVISNNPHTEIYGLDYIPVDRDKKYSIGVGLFGGLDPRNGGVLGVGISIHKKVVEF